MTPPHPLLRHAPEELIDFSDRNWKLLQKIWGGGTDIHGILARRKGSCVKWVSYTFVRSEGHLPPVPPPVPSSLVMNDWFAFHFISYISSIVFFVELICILLSSHEGWICGLSWLVNVYLCVITFSRKFNWAT